MKCCPTCGQPLLKNERKLIYSADELLALLRSGMRDKRRDVYRSNQGTWHVTYVGTQVHRSAVDELLARDAIVRTYSKCADCYCLGPTWDEEATMAARRAGNKHANVFIPGTER